MIYDEDIDIFFCIAPQDGNPWQSGRIDAMHVLAFHGQGLRSENDESRQAASKETWIKMPGGGVRNAAPPSPSIDNNNRMPLRLWRSGRFVPEMFMASEYSLIVSEALSKQLRVVSDIELLQVIFKKLFNLPMPDIGDLSWSESIFAAGEADKQIETVIDEYNDVAEYHNSIESYHEIVPYNISINRDSFPDLLEFTPNYGTFFCVNSGLPNYFSATAMRQYPILWGGCLCLREDIFAVIAPSLNLDYFSVAVVYT